MSLALKSVNHIGIRVTDRQRSLDFYALFGFSERFYFEPDNVSIIENDCGVEINLIVNAASDHDGTNMLMDVPTKYPGYTHVAFDVDSIDDTVAALERADIPITGGPVRLGQGTSLFVRDPDRNVLELRQKD